MAGVMLNDRKLRILEAIINDYIMTAEPIGSRTIAKKYDIGISSATIRNEMSDLEEMGLIIQPHASAGRVPSDKGYRLYVDALMQNRDITEEQAGLIAGVVSGSITRIDYLMRETARMIAQLTGYITIATEPPIARTRIKHIQLVPIDGVSMLLVVITNAKAVRSQVISVESSPDHVTLARMTELLNSRLDILADEGVTPRTARELFAELGGHESAIKVVAASLNDIIAAEDSRRVYTSGVKNILSFPEFSDMERAREIIDTMEESDTLITLLDNGAGENVQIVIGSENGLAHMRDLSLIKAGYRFGDRPAGSIGIIGPTRMDYPSAVAILKTIVRDINDLLNST